jgi:hypothetical protein
MVESVGPTPAKKLNLSVPSIRADTNGRAQYKRRPLRQHHCTPISLLLFTFHYLFENSHRRKYLFSTTYELQALSPARTAPTANLLSGPEMRQGYPVVSYQLYMVQQDASAVFYQESQNVSFCLIFLGRGAVFFAKISCIQRPQAVITNTPAYLSWPGVAWLKLGSAPLGFAPLR